MISAMARSSRSRDLRSPPFARRLRKPPSRAGASASGPERRRFTLDQCARCGLPFALTWHAAASSAEILRSDRRSPDWGWRGAGAWPLPLPRGEPRPPLPHYARRREARPDRPRRRRQSRCEPANCAVMHCHRPSDRAAAFARSQALEGFRLLVTGELVPLAAMAGLRWRV
jgi:hypothetical protein